MSLHANTIIVIEQPGFDWGSFAEWVGALATLGALIVAFLIFMGDRRSRKREEADSFTMWNRVFSMMDKRTMDTQTYVEVNFYNAGIRPIPMAQLRSWNGIIWHATIAETGLTEPYVIPPGESAITQTLMLSELLPENYFVTFTDNRGVTWNRSVRTGKYISNRRVKRWSKRKPDAGAV